MLDFDGYYLDKIISPCLSLGCGHTLYLLLLHPHPTPWALIFQRRWVRHSSRVFPRRRSKSEYREDLWQQGDASPYAGIGCSREDEYVAFPGRTSVDFIL